MLLATSKDRQGLLPLVALTTAAGIAYYSWSSSKSRCRSSEPREYPPLASASTLETLLAVVNGGSKEFTLKCFQECGRIFRIRLPIPGVPMAVVIANVEDIREIFRDPTTTKPAVFYNAISKFTGGPNVASISHGDAWYHRRKPMNLAFAPKRIHAMNEIAMQVVQEWATSRERFTSHDQQDSEEVYFDVGKELIDMTVQIICQAALDFPTTREQRTRLMEDMTPAFQEFSMKEGFNPLRKFATWMLPDRQRAIVGLQNLQLFAAQVIDHYRNNPSPTPDTVIDVIMKNPIYQNDRERAADIIIILFAGHDTTGYTMAVALLELAKHPEEQDRLRQALTNTKSERDGEDDNTGADSWSYLKAVITETMRLHPAVTGAGFRQLGRDYISKAGGYFVPKGTVLFMSQIAIYRDPALFDNPFEFVPSRWLKSGASDDNHQHAMKRAMFPFALGKRNCVGQSLANAELYSVLPYLITNFEFSVDKPGVISHPATMRLDDCWLKAKRRI